LDSIQADIEAAYRRESRRVLATLLRLLNGNFDVAEEALQEAFVEAVKYWPEQGVPGNPRT
jgi:RNA polymerase sigma-70 factor (ECF subfamily)